MRIGYNQGRRQLVAAGEAQTNDLGEYRLYDIAGGKYYVSATYRNAPQAAPGKDRYLPAYYPGTNDPCHRCIARRARRSADARHRPDSPQWPHCYGWERS